MAKVDKSLYSKQEFKLIKEERRIAKLKQVNKENRCGNIVNIVCLKHGVKYSPDYVNKLYYGVKNNLTLPFKFYCLTESSKNVCSDINVLPLPEIDIQGWWYKPYVFSKDLPIQGTILYLDLDLVITGNLDKLFSFAPTHFCIIRDFNRILRPNYDRFNSSVMRFEHGNLDYLWQKFKKEYKKITSKFFGDQDFIYHEKKGQAQYFPDQWIKSWKWEIRKSRKFAPRGIRGNRKLQGIEDVVPPRDCCIAVFHGDPNPHLCDDPYIKKTWTYKE